MTCKFDMEAMAQDEHVLGAKSEETTIVVERLLRATHEERVDELLRNHPGDTEIATLLYTKICIAGDSPELLQAALEAAVHVGASQVLRAEHVMGADEITSTVIAILEPDGLVKKLENLPYRERVIAFRELSSSCPTGHWITAVSILCFGAQQPAKLIAAALEAALQIGAASVDNPS